MKRTNEMHTVTDMELRIFFNKSNTAGRSFSFSSNFLGNFDILLNNLVKFTNAH